MAVVSMCRENEPQMWNLEAPDVLVGPQCIRRPDRRCMVWMVWKYSIGGELYFSTNEAYASKYPWNDVYVFRAMGTALCSSPVVLMSSAQDAHPLSRASVSN